MSFVVTFDAPSESMGYLCTWNGCNKKEYENNTDYGFYSKENGNCDICIGLCDSDKECEGIECGWNYCSWWKNGKCKKRQEYTIKSSVLKVLPALKTCIKLGRINVTQVK